MSLLLREAGAENHAGIDVVAAGNNTVLQAGLAFVEIRLHELLGQRLQVDPLDGFSILDRLIVFPPVKTFAALSAELAGADHLPEQY